MQRDGVGLCLSGGGYRAMLFHTGVLWRLNELGILAELDVISGVSGGAIASGALARAWHSLDFRAGVSNEFTGKVVRPIRALAGTTIDIPAIVRGALKPWRTIGEELSAALRRELFGTFTLRDLPSRPAFDFNATNLRNGARWLFSREWMGDALSDWVADPNARLAVAVAASSAFPPFLSPVVLRLPGRATRVVLTDGGVYDNLSVEPVIDRCATVLASDGGGRLERPSEVPRPWLRQTVRVLHVVDSRVRQLRTTQLLESYRDGHFAGAYWGIYSDIDEFAVDGTLPAPLEQTRELAALPSRLQALPARTQQHLINWGYAVADAGLRSWVVPDAAPPAGFPYPSAGVGSDRPAVETTGPPT